MQVDKNFLEHAVELESKQHLRAKDQEARLVEGVFKLSLQALRPGLNRLPSRL
jgi:hypothetical protein